MSDGSVIKRYSQAPKDEIRMINDQRNNLMWNPNNNDLRNGGIGGLGGDLQAKGKVNKFKQKLPIHSKKKRRENNLKKVKR